MESLAPAPSTIVVFSLLSVTFSAVPSIERSASSIFMPLSVEITVAPVSTAMSSSISLRRSPKPGALQAAIFNVPRSLLTTSADSASPSTSSATISSERPLWATGSKTPMSSFIVEIFLSVIRI